MARALALDVTDAGVLGLAEGGALVGPSPGYALVEPDGILVGEAAHRRARLRPRFVMSRFWERLDAEPLGRPFPGGLTSADLVHAHLRDLWSRLGGGVGEVILAAPGVYGSEALGRLLGIVQALDMPVVGLVDTAVAAAAAGYPMERLLLVDAHLHRATVTEMRQAREVIRERVSTIDGWGLDEVHEALARRIAERFVQETRFDPLHSAETEQALHDRLPAWLEDLRRDDRALLTLAGGRREHEIEVTRSDVEDWGRAFAEELAQRVSSPPPARGADHAPRLGAGGAPPGPGGPPVHDARHRAGPARRAGRGRRCAAGTRGPSGQWGRAAVRHPARPSGAGPRGRLSRRRHPSAPAPGGRAPGGRLRSSHPRAPRSPRAPSRSRAPGGGHRPARRGPGPAPRGRDRRHLPGPLPPLRGRGRGGAGGPQHLRDLRQRRADRGAGRW